jgi:hypothetical protein
LDSNWNTPHPTVPLNAIGRVTKDIASIAVATAQVDGEALLATSPIVPTTVVAKQEESVKIQLVHAFLDFMEEIASQQLARNKQYSLLTASRTSPITTNHSITKTSMSTLQTVRG